MSKTVVQDQAKVRIDAFASLLPKLEDPIPGKATRGRLGRTAEGLQKLQDEARELGLEEGRAQGIQEGREIGAAQVWTEMESSIAAFRAALDDAASRIETQMEAWYHASEQHLSELAVSIAARILGRELETTQDCITELTRDALREITTADKVRIRVNPFDSPILTEQKQLVLSANPTVRGIEVVEDPSISGGARIESDSGAIDATIRTQLELAIAAIRGGA